VLVSLSWTVRLLLSLPSVTWTVSMVEVWPVLAARTSNIA
jgi:hypothetical protein